MADWDDVRRALRRPAKSLDAPGVAQSAVSVLLLPERRLWLIRRADRPGDPWSGHLAFPGGRAQPSDPDLFAAARRETFEELGLDLAPAEHLGRLDDLRTRPVRSLMVRPHVFVWDHVPTVQPNHEVAGVLQVDFDHLLEGRGRGRMLWPGPVGIALPCVELPEGRLWGLTLQMIDDLLDRVDGRGTGLARPALG